MDTCVSDVKELGCRFINCGRSSGCDDVDAAVVVVVAVPWEDPCGAMRVEYDSPPW